MQSNHTGNSVRRRKAVTLWIAFHLLVRYVLGYLWEKFLFSILLYDREDIAIWEIVHNGASKIGWFIVCWAKVCTTCWLSLTINHLWRARGLFYPIWRHIVYMDTRESIAIIACDNLLFEDRLTVPEIYPLAPCSSDYQKKFISLISLIRGCTKYIMDRGRRTM